GIVYFIIAALYLAAAVTTVLVSRPGNVKERDGKSPLEDIADGMRYVRANPPIFGLIMLSIVPFLFAMPVNALLPAFNEDILGGGPDDLGLLMSAMGGGAIVGSLTMASMGGLRHKGRWLVATCVIWGVSTVAVGLSETVLLASVMVAAFGWLSAWNMSLNRGLLQLRVSDRMRGRVMSIDMMSHGLMPLGVIPIGFIAERYDIAIALVCAGLVFVVAIGALALLSSSVRTVDTGRA
ncbi:MAG: MFS transporter, partial [Gammaproteobacteria bacterium]|nr:MFS transporter [Gammaproteobacteria bacterium]